MTTHRTLTEYHHVSGQNVRPFNSNRYRNALIAAAQVIIWPKHNAFTTMHIHRIIDDLAHFFSQMVLTNGGDNRRFFT